MPQINMQKKLKNKVIELNLHIFFISTKPFETIRNILALFNYIR